MMLPFFLFALFSIKGVLLKGSTAASWYVSRSGSDTQDCGKTNITPCQSIAIVANKTHPGDVVYLNGTNSGDPYRYSSHFVSDGLSFLSYGDSKAFIEYEKTFQVRCSSSTQNVSLRGLVFLNTAVVILKCSVVLHSCSFHMLSKKTSLSLKFDGMTRRNIVIDKCQFKDNHVIAGCVTIGGYNLKITVTDTTFQNNILDKPLKSAVFRVTSPTTKNYMSFNNVKFINNRGRAVWISPFYTNNQLTAFTLYDNGAGQLTTYGVAEMFINSSTFHNNDGGGFFVEALTGSKLTIKNSTFSSNSNFTFSVQNCSEVSLHNIRFTDNNCLVGSKNPPLILFYMSNVDVLSGVLNISGSKFHNNTCDLSVMRVSSTQQHMISHQGEGCDARANTSTYFREKYPTKVNITNSEFFNNSGMSKSTLLLQNGDVTLLNTNFTDSFGFVSGSHISVIEGSVMLYMINTTFLQTVGKKKIWNREVPFSGALSMANSGQLHILAGSSIKAEFFGDVDPLIIVQGANKVVVDNSSAIECSYGSMLQFNNLTHCGLESTDPSKTPQFVKVITFTFVCSACPVGTYSIHKGFSTGFQIHSNFTCHTCPFGAECTNNLAAQPNFWGYPVSGDKVNFVICPSGYCCSNKELSCNYSNDTYYKSGCQGNRTGILCGECRENFTETLFSSHCQLKNSCNDWWWSSILALSCILMFALYLIHKPPILQIALRNLFWFSKTPYKLGLEDSQRRKKQSHLGFMKILFYYYQIAALLTVPSNGTYHILGDYIILPFVGLFSFTFYDNTHFAVCPFQGLTQTLKTALPLLGVITLHLSVLCIYFFHAVINKLSKRSTVFPPIDPYLAASMECLLLSYSALTQTLLKLLCWIQIDGKLLWYYDAAVTLYPHWWQVASIVSIMTLVVPFIFVLRVGSRKLYSGLISPGHFILACYIPLPFLIYWLVKYCRAAVRKNNSAQEMVVTSALGTSDEWSGSTEVKSMAGEHSLVFEVLSAPFRKPEDQKSLGMIHWESVLIGRRFVLIAALLFIPKQFLTSVCLTVLCLLVLVHHVMQKPFSNQCANVIETLSLASLVVIATLNIAVGVFYSSGIQVPVSYSLFVMAFLYIEAVLLGAVPVAFALIAVVCCMSQMLRMLFFVAKLGRCTLSRQSSSRMGHEHPSEPLISEVIADD